MIYKFKDFVFNLNFSIKIFVWVLAMIFLGLAITQMTVKPFGFFLGILIYIVVTVFVFLAIFFAYQILFPKFNKKKKTLIEHNSFLTKYTTDYRYRTIVVAVGGLFFNILFAIVNGFFAIMYSSAWLGSLSAYYLVLSFMRFGVVEYIEMPRTRKKIKDVDFKELSVYHKVGFMFILMTIALVGMLIMMIIAEQSKTYPSFVIYVIALYTFIKVGLSIYHIIKAKNSNSYLVKTLRNISHADALVSLVSLQVTMIITFGGIDDYRKMLVLNILSGTVVLGVILIMGIIMIYESRNIKK